MIRMMLCDDHVVVCAGPRRVLDAIEDIDVVAAPDGLDAADSAVRHRPDVALMDLSMPTLDAVQATPRIVARVPDTKVAV